MLDFFILSCFVKAPSFIEVSSV